MFAADTQSRNVLCASFSSCQYLAEKFCPDSNEDSVLHDHAVCICDDDNDVEMASACRHAYIPSISSENMSALIEKFPDHFSLTGGKKSKAHGTTSSEIALSMILTRLEEEEETRQARDLEDGEKEEATP